MSVRFTYGKRKPFKIGTASRIVSDRRTALVQRIERLLSEAPAKRHILGEIASWQDVGNGQRIVTTCFDAKNGSYFVHNETTDTTAVMQYAEILIRYKLKPI